MPVEPQRIIDYLRHEAGRPLGAKELAAGLGVAPPDRPAFKELLDQLEGAGALYRVQRLRYAAPERINLVAGRLSVNRRGFGFVSQEGDSPDIYIPADGLHSAHDGDRVMVRLERGRGERSEGRVIRVLERGRSTVVGTFHERTGPHGAHGYVTPQDRRLRWDVMVPAGQTGAAASGELVVVRITDWGGAARGPEGVVERVLGRLGDPGVDVEAIIHAHELPTDFPEDVAAQAEQIREAGIRATDLEGREDLRELLVFTIDPADAKDHDDALSIRPHPEGGWEVGVHIADVSHYVRPGSALDREALLRGTSIYLVDRVIPMLPHALSSELCSLQPDQDRLALSLLVRLDEAAAVLGERLVRSVIRSRRKLAYEDAQAVLDGGTEDPAIVEALQRLVGLSRLLRQQREARGSLDFDLPEARVVLNAAGEATDIQRRERLEAHRLIEDFMLLANETVARKAAAAKTPFIYRIHEKPAEARLESLREFAATLGYRLGKGTPQDLQRLLHQASGRPDEGLISTVLLRSMQQARYAAENDGHFGLAARHYAHFTSPIRRYPDLVVHRISTSRFIDREPPSASTEELTELAQHCSERERAAMAAERDSIALKKVEFMAGHLDAEFDGAIADVRAFGFFVLLDAYFVEGLVHVSSLADDYYIFLEEQFALVGENTRRRFRVGDRVRVRVSTVDLELRQIDLALVDPAGKRTAARGEKRGAGSGPKKPAGSGPKKPAGKGPRKGRRKR